MCDQTVTITTKRNEIYSCQINRCSQKACGWVQLTRYFTALELIVYLFCERPPPPTDLGVLSSLFFGVMSFPFSTNCHDLCHGAMSCVFLTIASQGLVPTGIHVRRMNGCSLLKATQCQVADEDEDPDPCRLRLVSKKWSHLKNAVSHENSSCWIKARRNPSKIKNQLWSEKFTWVTIVNLLLVTLQVMLAIEQSPRIGCQSNRVVQEELDYIHPRAASTGAWSQGMERVAAHQLVTTRDEDPLLNAVCLPACRRSAEEGAGGRAANLLLEGSALNEPGRKGIERRGEEGVRN